jgi:hypothetical protein
MDELIKRFSKFVKGYISGFDRIVFKGMLLPLMYSQGAMDFCRTRGILNKDYKAWMMKNTAAIVEFTDQYAKSNCGQGIIPISTWRIRKEELAHERQKSEGIKQGLIGVWSCQEGGSSYRASYCAKTGYPQLQNYQTRCKHLYFYFDHENLGFMNIRLQTWFPYNIQVHLNGREWLRRQLESEKVGFCVHKNKFFQIDDYEKAQRILNAQLDSRWTNILSGFLPTVFPMMADILGDHLSYYWTMWQSEWASDLIFNSPEDLSSIMDSLIRHAHMTGTSTRVLRYLDRPVKMDGSPDLRSKDEVITRINRFNDGLRIRHWVDNNSVKAYNEQNVLRIEMTMNKPEKFRVHRQKQNPSLDEKKSRLPLRKGVSDVVLRARVSNEINQRFMKDIATLNDKTPAYEVIDKITTPRTQDRRRIRALDPTGKDRELLKVIADPKFRLAGLTNKSLREGLANTQWASNRTEKQLSARASRYLRLLRDHGIIKKLPEQNRYQITTRGVTLTNILNAFLAASTQELMKMAA